MREQRDERAGRGSREDFRSSLRRRAASVLRTMLVLALAALLPGCGAWPGGAPASPLDEETVTWQYDKASRRWYVPAGVMTQQETIHEALPTIEPTLGVWTEGRFSDPGERISLPAPDDYWIQLVVQLDPQARQSLIADSADDTVPADDVAAELVPTMDPAAGTCEDGWTDAIEALRTSDSSAPRLGTGDTISLAAICPSTGVLVVSAVDS